MRLPLLTLAISLSIFACAKEVPPPQIVDVIVDTVRTEPYRPESEYVGRLQAQEDVTIRAQVSGYLLTRDFREGDFVGVGDVLYTIEASEYKATLARAKAQLASAIATQANAKRNFNRGQELLPKGAISQAEMDNLTAKKLDADAQIESANAQIASAEVDVGFTTIIAPIAGRIGRSMVTPGDLVGPTSGDLTTLVSIDPIQALFQISESTYLAAIGPSLSKKLEELSDTATQEVEVTLQLTNKQLYPEVGKIDYFANRIDTTTGTMEARALIPNPAGLLVPGQYVRVILQNTNLTEGVFVAQAAVQADQQGSFVLLVDDENKVVRKNIELGDRIDDDILVKIGLNEGETVIVRGLQQVRPGMIVTTTAIVRDEY